MALPADMSCAVQLRTVKRKASLPSLACQTAANMVPLTAEVPKSRLHRSTKASAASQVICQILSAALDQSTVQRQHTRRSCCIHTASSACQLVCVQAQLISHAQQLGIDHSGTKKLLVDRIHAALSINVAEDIARQVQVLR